MADVAALAAKVPAAWQRALLPFIQRSAEFEQVKQPIVGFYLLQYVAHNGMKLHKSSPNKAETTPFIMALLDVLEAKIALYAAQIAEIDGRTEVSRAALALFSRADDDERRGVVSEAIVKLFYSSSLLFEATKQFMDDDQMDPFAAEKHKYAQVVAARMKKALASGTPYESPSGAKERVEGVADVDGGMASPAGGMPQPPPPPPSEPPAPVNNYSYTPPAAVPPVPSPSASGSNGYAYTPPAPAPAAAPSPAAGGYNYTPPAPAPAPVPQQHQMPPPPAPKPAAAPQMPSYVPPSAPPGSYNPTPNDMIDAQKYAKLAVSALQFYDHQNARKQLLLALQYLDGQAQK